MYVQHPYKYDGKYYAKIDGKFYEISKEVAMAMFSEYRKEVYRSRMWAPVDPDEAELEKRIEEEKVMEKLQELNAGKKEMDVLEYLEKQKPVKKKNKVKPTEILDCAFSANAEGLSVNDLADQKQCGIEELMIKKEEHEVLYEKIGRLSEQEQLIISSIFFKGMKHKDVAEMLGVSREAISQRVSTILKKMRTMYLNA